MNELIVRAPASSANLGAGFDVFGMALGLYADVGTGTAPSDARQLDAHHPASIAYERLGGDGEIWLRSAIPTARGLGFSGAVRVAGAALAVVESGMPIGDRAAEILRETAALEGHGDNVAASMFGNLTAFVDGRAIPFRVGPVLARASFIAWIPDTTTSTESSRNSLHEHVERAAAIDNIGRAAQFALAFAHDDPELLIGATQDRLHQAERIAKLPGAADAMVVGVESGAWCAWLSGSGPTIGMLADAAIADQIAAALPAGAHTKVLAIDTIGVHQLASTR